MVMQGERVARLPDPVTQLLELPFMKNVLFVLEEKLADPQEKSLHSFDCMCAIAFTPWFW